MLQLEPISFSFGISEYGQHPYLVPSQPPIFLLGLTIDFDSGFVVGKTGEAGCFIM
jgi:hypothetical protein